MFIRQNLNLHLHQGWNAVVAYFSMPEAGHVVSNLTVSSERAGQKWYFFHPPTQP